MELSGDFSKNVEGARVVEGPVGPIWVLGVLV